MFLTNFQYFDGKKWWQQKSHKNMGEKSFLFYTLYTLIYFHVECQSSRFNGKVRDGLSNFHQVTLMYVKKSTLYRLWGKAAQLAHFLLYLIKLLWKNYCFLSKLRYFTPYFIRKYILIHPCPDQKTEKIINEQTFSQRY